jgi:succinate dehydrogenase/fumarate reductase flavoprotein subunit
MSYLFTKTTGQLYCNENSETSVRGLFAAGDEFTHGISAAATFGWFGGEHAAEHAKNGPPGDPDHDDHKVEKLANLTDAIQKRRTGYDWKDANIALQKTMCDYAGGIRSEHMLNAGLNHLRRIRAKVDDALTATDRWELSRCLEVLNLYDLGELVFLSALERKESRGEHRRIDYPSTDPLLNGKLSAIRQVNGEPEFYWKKLKHG